MTVKRMVDERRQTEQHLFLFTVTSHPRTAEYSATCISAVGVHGPWWATTAAEALTAAREGTKSMIARDIDQAPAVARVKGEPYSDGGVPFQGPPVPDENIKRSECDQDHHGVDYCRACYPGGKPT